jgi:hypothetical protein
MQNEIATICRDAHAVAVAAVQRAGARLDIAPGNAGLLGEYLAALRELQQTTYGLRLALEAARNLGIDNIASS